MSQILNDVGVCEYGGYTFDGASHVTVRCEPVYDEARRTVGYHRYIVNVKGIVADPGNTNLSLRDIRYRLTKPGQSFRLYDKGFYNLYANCASPDGYINDVAFGPKPKILSWAPVGSSMACEIEWECEVCIAYCAAPRYHAHFLAFNYTVTYGIDLRGLTVRSISGYYEIAMTRTLYTVPMSCDSFRHHVNPVIPERFQRTRQDWNLSNDRRRMDFAIVDTELPSNNPWPLGVVKVDAKHRVVWSRARNSATFRNVISVEVEMAPNQPMLNAFCVFANIVKARRVIAKANYDTETLLDEITAVENIYDRTCSFTAGYRILKSRPRRLLADSGLWTPLEKNTWEEWADSISDITDQRGYANHTHIPAADPLIDPCGASYSIPWDWSATEKEQESLLGKELLANEIPEADKSWLKYRNTITIYRNRKQVHQEIMQAPDADDVDWSPHDTSLPNFPATGGVDNIVQRGGKTSFRARMTGMAVRAGYVIPKPAITSIGTATARLKNDDGFSQDILDTWLGLTIYRAKWDLWYDLDKAPEQVPSELNIGLDDTSGLITAGM